ncbi:MAG: methylated-DNA--[protein]-cysteine S-methyltransferase, partial [Planctomycetes bacterium]|nr:methylated-DNA--[protein]-cysteine S-methyltransferase [Planctomycetota bacterium]
MVSLEWSPEGLLSLRWGGAATAGSAPAPGWVQGLIARLQAHLGGSAADPLRDVPVDDRTWSPFDRRVLRALRGVGPGERVTYGELARRAG